MTRHAEAIVKLCAERRLRTEGFREAVRAELCVDCDLASLDDDAIAALPPLEGGIAHWQEVESDLSVRPDAYKILPRELHCYEVVDTSGLTDGKRHAYAKAWRALDCFGVRLRLFVCDLYDHCHEFTPSKWLYRTP